MEKAKEIELKCLEQDLLARTKTGLENLIDIGWLNASLSTNEIIDEINNAIKTIEEEL